MIPILSHFRVAIPISVPELRHLHLHFHGIPMGKWETGIPIPDGDIYREVLRRTQCIIVAFSAALYMRTVTCLYDTSSVTVRTLVYSPSRRRLVWLRI